MRYWVELSNGIVGPVEWPGLVEMARDGSIQPDTWIELASGTRVRAHEIDGLIFAPPAAPSAEQTPSSSHAAQPGLPSSQAYHSSGFNSYLVPSIFAALFCCQLVGIPALVYAALAESAKNAGNMAAAESHADTARTLLGWSVASGVIMILIVVSNAPIGW